MESQPQNPEFRNNPENFHQWGYGQRITTPHKLGLNSFNLCTLAPGILTMMKKFDHIIK